MWKGILRQAVASRASDIHLTPGLPPIFRLNGKLIPEQGPVLTAEDLDRFFSELANLEQQEVCRKQGGCDFSYSLAGMSRFRVHVFCQQGLRAMTLRIIRDRVYSIAELELPPMVETLSRLHRGLILVTGPAGSGKSSTLAAMVDLINRERSCHIVTLEDPVEYLHQHQKSIIHQREIPRDVPSFAQALRHVLRQDPDVIMVGEMRDGETISTTITAAETGHLVLATLHTASAAQTVERIIDSFPAAQQQQIRMQLANTLQGIIAQQLIPRKGGGRVAALEILTGTPAVRSLIREGKTHQLLSIIQTGNKFGMITMDGYLEGLWRKQLIDRAEALKIAAEPELFI